MTLCLGGLTAALTQTMVIPIQSELPTLLGASAASTAWVITVTLLAGAVANPIAGRIADLLGKQRVLVVCAALLLVGSVVVALSNSLGPVLVGRALQGFAMGFIPVEISLIRELSGPDRAATSVATMSATLGVGGAVGLPLGAWLAQLGSWHTLFWASAVLALVIVALTAITVPNTHDGSSGSLDVVGALGLALGLSVFLVGVSKATTWGWVDPRTGGCIVAGVAVLAVWACFEMARNEPLVDVRASTQRTVLFTNFAAVAVGFGMMAQSIVVPQLLQLPEATGYGLGRSVLAAGLWMAPAGLMMMVFAPVSSALIHKRGARITLMAGSTIIAVGYLAALFLMGAPWQLLIASAIGSAGVGVGYAAMPTLIMDVVSAREAASAVGLNSLMRSTGTTLAAAVMGTILTGNTTQVAGLVVPSQHAFTLCFIIGSAAALVGAGLAAMVPVRSGTLNSGHALVCASIAAVDVSAAPST